MRFYKLAGSEQYVSWDTLHNVAGYSEQATNEITWKSVENWGTSAGTGYELPVELFDDSELFMDDVFGWHDLDWFALEQGVYPSSASDMVLTHPTYGSSPVVFMVFDDGTYYLIQKDISQGWMTEEEYSERGWQLPGYIVLNSETGAILGAAKGHELETVPIPACTIASADMVSVPIPARVLESPGMVVYVPEPEPEPEYEQINLYIPGGGSNYYYYQGGVTSSSAWNPTDSYTKTLYDSTSLTNVARVRPGVRYEPGYVSNNGWVPYTPQNLSGMPASQSSSDYKTTYLVQTLNGSVQFWYVTNFPNNSVYETYSLDPYYFAFRLYPAQYIDVILALNGDGTGVTFSADDYWASNVKATDVMYSLRDFGVPTRTASDSSQSIVIDRTAFENFTFVPIALYTDTAGIVDTGADMSNFYCKVGGNGTGIYGTSVNIRSINAYNTTVCRWKCRITRINGGN